MSGVFAPKTPLAGIGASASPVSNNPAQAERHRGAGVSGGGTTPTVALMADFSNPNANESWVFYT